MCKLIANYIKYSLIKDKMTIDDLAEKIGCIERYVEDVVIYKKNDKSVISKIEKEFAISFKELKANMTKSNVEKSRSFNIERKVSNKNNLTNEDLPNSSIKFNKKPSQLQFNIP